MRLLDEITQRATPLWVIADSPTADLRLQRLPGAFDFADQLRTCPLRYVLDDGLTEACVDLALAGGDRLSGCLDLIRLPAQRFWVEWNDSVRERLLRGAAAARDSPACARAGALVESSADGRRGLLRSFWADAEGLVCLAPLETHLDLSGEWPRGESAAAAALDGCARLVDPQDPELETLLDCMRFRFQEPWAAYYREAQLAPFAAERLLRASLATVARDMPIVLAFALLLGARNGVQQRVVDHGALNRRRLARHKAPLLAHIEVRCLAGAEAHRGGGAREESSGRRAPRLHQVRGHLVRRANELFWRRAHVRGRAAAGRILTRTVRLSFAAARAP